MAVINPPESKLAKRTCGVLPKVSLVFEDFYFKISEGFEGFEGFCLFIGFSKYIRPTCLLD
jgi:hypothetical protein